MLCANAGGAPAQVSYTLSDMFLRGTNMDQLLNTHPVLLKLGHSSNPSMRRSFYEKAALLEYDGSYMAAARAAGAQFFKCGDWRCVLRSMHCGVSCIPACAASGRAGQ